MTVVREHITLSQIAAKAKVSRAAVGCVLLGTGKGKSGLEKKRQSESLMLLVK